MDKPKIDLQKFNKNSWTDDERSNVQVMVEFFNLLIADNEFKGFKKRFSSSEYLQHNRIVESGLNPLIEFTRQLVKMLPEFYSELKHVYADGDYVIFRSHATMKVKHRGNDSKGLIIVDTWKLEDGRIIEHWDCIQPLSFAMRFFLLLGGGRKKNDNGIF